MSSIVATADNAKAQVRLDLDFSDVDAPYAYVQRVDPSTGATTPVRGHGFAATIGALPYAPMQAGYKAVLYDAEAPLDTAFYYTATAPSATLNANPTFSAGFIDPWYPTLTTVTLKPGANRSGAKFLTMSGDGATANPTIRAEDIAATPGATFTFTVTSSASVAQNVTVSMSFRDASGAILSSPFATAPVLAATTIVATGTAPANTVSVQPIITMQSTPLASTILSVTSAVLANAASTATSGGALLQSLGSCRLKDPLRPSLNVRVDFCFDPNPQCIPAEGIFWQSLDVESQAANSAAFNVNNQANPVVVSKARSSPTSTLTLVSRTFPDRDRLVNLLASGSPLLFQAPDEYGLPDRYLSVGASSVARVLPDHRFPIRVVTMPHSVVSGPGGPMQGTVGARWQDTCNQFATWAAINTAGLTWVQILDGAAG